MGLFDMFNRSTDKMKDDTSDLDSNAPQSNLVENDENNYSNIIPNDIIEEIMNINNIKFISDMMIRRMEKYPELITLLLEGNVSEHIKYLLMYEEKLTELPWEIEDLKFVKFFDYDERIKKLLSLLDNRVDNYIDNYEGGYIDLNTDFEPIEYHDEIDSWIPDIKIKLSSTTLIKLPSYSRFKIYFPKDKHKIVTHLFDEYIVESVDLDEDTIIQMDYFTFCNLDDSIINKISKCKIVFSDDKIQLTNEDEEYLEDNISYDLAKFNHLIYIIENSSLDDELKEKLVYKIKNIYLSDDDMFDYLEIKNKILPFLNDLDIEEIKRLTDEFELNIDKYKNKPIEKPPFNVKYYIDERFPDLNQASVSDVIRVINYLPEDLKILALKESRVLEKLGISEKLDEEETKKLSYLLAQRLSTTTLEFINSLDFDIKAFMSDPNNNYISSFDINPIIGEYGVFDDIYEEREISIADIIGHDNRHSSFFYGRNILYTFEKFFEKNGDGYHTRALGLLEYKSGKELIEGLNRTSLGTTDMKIREIEDGKYVVSENGLHRFTVLRFHYLLDCMKNEKTPKELREIYKIPVTISSKTNFKRTYCNYIMHKSNLDISHMSFSPYEDKITIYYEDGKTQEINDDTLLEFTRQSVDMMDEDSLVEFQGYYNTLDSFHSFVDTYIPDVVSKFDSKSKEGIKL